jgi:hypothetical protein
VVDYGASLATLGFRCVTEIPTAPDVIRTLIARQS